MFASLVDRSRPVTRNHSNSGGYILNVGVPVSGINIFWVFHPDMAKNENPWTRTFTTGK